MTAQAVLRQMTLDDLPAIMAIERSTFPSDAWSEGMMRGELNDQPRTRHYVVALVGDTIVGYAGLAAAADQADIQTIAVLPEHRRSGIGAALMEALLAEAVRRGATTVFLEVRADNVPAQAMYERFGFQRFGLRRRYYDDGTDAITMVRELLGELGERGSGHEQA
ncbi:ribosomal protein S18-alanine N-acetyltransferase [Planotetraspora sp. A-T 1434]|uniref:ribosomal protein S18-alanine N-acetyltransferase n=1 Tax=Planotetraspora sp. A-T 1434 TaxID=2979219 RepID=UPI0021C0BB8E|nr:ribosomal protein S18-alanine N-acetyltransferase [Planotetraspora sp. A-T 1434]MCT9928655.1 ribosomal protein S18-alanine N-acetyltransferase [Planotetraspora sp. A-T 1434]